MKLYNLLKVTAIGLILMVSNNYVYSQWPVKNPDYIIYKDGPNLSFLSKPAGSCSGNCTSCAKPLGEGSTGNYTDRFYFYEGSGISGDATSSTNFTGTNTISAKYRDDMFLVTTNLTCGCFECNFAATSTTTDHTFTITSEDFVWTAASLPKRCLDGSSINLYSYFNVSSGVIFSGPGVSGFTLVPSSAGAGTHIITASKAYDNGTASKTINVVINALPSLTFSSIPNTCSDEADIDLYNYMNINGGTLTSSTAASAIISNRYFRPSNASAGTHNINWSYTNGNGCTSSTSKTITVVATFTVNPGANQSACKNSGSVTLTASTAGVSWSCVSCSYVSAGKFNTNTAPTGTYTVRATKNVNGCIKTAEKSFTVKSLPVVNAGSTLQYCVDAGAVTLNQGGVTPSGGTWSSGNGTVNTAISNGASTVNVSVISPGSYTLTYFYTNASGCSSSDTRTLTVRALPNNTGLTVTGASRCGSGTVTLTASHTDGNISFEWYSAASGGSVLYTGNSYTTPSLSSTRSYYVEMVNQYGCRAAGRVAASATVNAVPTNPISSNQARCGTGTVTLTASGGTGGATYKWYENASGGSPVKTGSSFTTPSLSTTRSYYVNATSAQGCASPGRTKVDVTINAIPGVPTIFNGSNCGAGIVNLSVGGAPAGGSYRWYSASTGGSSFNSTNTHSPNISTTTSYWASIMSAQGCEGPRAEVVGTIFPDPTAPDGLDNNRCGPGVLTLNVTGTNAAGFNWYDTQASSISLNSGNSFSPNVSATRSYWVEMTDNNGCISDRDEVVATIHPVPSEPTVPNVGRCGTGTVALAASGSGAGATYDWYENPTGGTSLFTGASFTTPSLTSSKSYYVQATSGQGCLSTGRTEVLAEIQSVPSAPVVFDNFNCGAGVVNLTVGGAPAGGSYRWYTTGTGGTPFNSTGSFDANIALTESYWVSALSSAGCEGPRAEITASIYGVPDAPVGNNGERCGTGTVTLSATSDIAGTFNWYQTAASMVSLSTGATFVTPSLTATISYWTDITDANTCVSDRVEVIATINPVPTSPTAPGVGNCGPGQVTLTASGGSAGSMYSWYSNSAGGSPIFMGDVYQPFVGTTTNYYVDVTTPEGCTSLNRTQATVTINAVPSVPTVFGNSNCGPGTVSLSVGGTPAGGSYRWYISAGETVAFNTANSYEANISLTTSYWVSSVSAEGCEGTRAEIVATVNDIPNAPTGIGNERCGTGSIILSASSGIAGTLNWYETEASMVSLGVSNTFVTPVLTASTSYWVDITDTNGCTSPRTEVLSTVNPVPAAPLVPGVGRCGPGEVTIAASGSVAGAVYDWYTSLTGGSSIFTGTDYTATVTLTKNLYVSATSSQGCISATRTEVTATVNPLPGEPLAFGGDNCGPGTVALNVAGAPAGGEYRWYGSQAGGTSFNNTSSYNSNVNVTTSYWVSSVSAEGCEGPRAEIIASINEIPQAPVKIDGDRCGPGFVTLGASSPIAGTFNWYETEASAVSLGVSNTYVATGLTASTSFWVDITDANGCVSPRTEVFATVHPIPADPISTDVNRCGPGEVTITASGSVAGASYGWYSSSTGESLVFSGTDFNTNVTVSRKYYVSATSPEGCVSTNRTEVNVTVYTHPGEPLAFDGQNCGPGEVNLSVAGAAVGGSYLWYNSPTGGTSFNTTSSHLANISTTTSFWVSIVTAKGCEGLRKEVRGIINDTPLAPVGIDDQRCGTGTVTLSANSAIAGNSNWYASQASLASLFTGVNFTTPNISSTTSYWVDITDANGCTSPRTGVVATVNAIPVDPVAPNVDRCGPGEVTLQTSGSAIGAVYNWYENSSGGSPVYTGETFTTSVTFTRPYYVSATSLEGCISANRTQATVTINPFPGSPVTFAGENCGPGTVSLSVAGAVAGGGYRWYMDETTLTSFNNSATWEANISATTSYWVSIVTPEGCEGGREPIVATVNGLPTAPTGTNGERCGTGSVILSASANETGTFNWYQTQASAVSIFTGVNYTTYSLVETTSFWVEFTDANGCVSPRTEVVASVLSVLPDPVVPNVERCGPGLVSIAASSSVQGAIFNWYDNQFGGSPIFIGDTYQPNLALSRNYYVGATSAEGCTSVNRTPVTVTINPLPAVPNVQHGEVCGEGEVTMIASGASQGDSYYWYSDNASSEVIGTGSWFTSPVLTASRSYFVGIGSAFGCEGGRTEVMATINDFPTLPTVENVERCGEGSVVLHATTTLQGATIKWYINQSGGVSFATGNDITIYNLSETMVYYASVVGADGCESGRAELTAMVMPIIPADIGGITTVCINASAYDLSLDLTGVDLGDGIFVGPGVIGKDFYPGIAGVGNHEVIFLLTNEIGCLDDGKRFITVIDIKENGEELSFSEPQITRCISGGSIDLNSLPNLDGGDWTINAPEGSINVGIIDPQVAGMGEFTATYTVAVNGCTVTKDLDVNITASPVAPVIDGPPLICHGETTTLDIIGSTIENLYRWYQGDALVKIGNTFDVTPDTTTTYYVEAENTFGCISEKSEFTLDVVVVDFDFTTAPTTISVGERVEFVAGITAAGYNWNFGDALVSTEQNPSHIYFNQGVFDVSLTITTEEVCEGTVLKESLVTVEAEQMITGLNKGLSIASSSVYPQPFGSSFTIKIESTTYQEVKVILFTLTGKILKAEYVQLAVGSNELVYDDLQSIRGGVFHLRVIDAEQRTYDHRVIKID